MKFIKITLVLALACIVLGLGTIFGFYYYLKPQLPDVATLKDVELQTPMQVYTHDGKLIAQFGEKRRVPLKLDDIPQELIDAIIATEDSRFYEHYGFDPIGITRAAVAVISTGSASQGASTITQQLARNFFLSNEKKIMRKIKEIFIAVHIEQLLTKQEILELYLNKIYLGHRSYGVGAAAEVYFGEDIKDLTLGELAVIAGLPKAPSTMNPIYSIERATTRRNVVLGRMLAEHKITQAQFDDARAEDLNGETHGSQPEVRAPYVAEIARAWMVKKFGEEAAYTSGMRIYTTVDSKLQNAANIAAVNNLINYDERHGYRGEEKVAWKPDALPQDQSEFTKYLRSQPSYGAMRPAIVTKIDGKTAQVFIKTYGYQTIEWDGMSWARRFKTDKTQGPSPKKASDILEVGQQVWVRPTDVARILTPQSDVVAEANQEDETAPEVTPIVWRLSQIPSANTAMVSIEPTSGRITSLVGGFNFVHNKFNRATQSLRQVGSSIKPFIYSAAIDDGMTLASLINDAPINQWDESAGTAWRPKNSPPTYLGPTRLRIGLAQSKNVMAVRVLRAVGLDKTRDYLTRFGFAKEHTPRSETIALGAGSLTPVQMAQGYSVFANGGYYVEPFYIERVENPYGEVRFQANPTVICKHHCDNHLVTDVTAHAQNQEVALTELTNEKGESIAHQDAQPRYAPRVVTPQTAFLVRELMYSNIWGGGTWSKGTGWNGTGFRAQTLHRRDIGGKTGTTNSSKDAWYSGFGPNVVAVTWVGFDNHNRNLGRTAKNTNLGKKQASGGEAGAKTAQPAWIDFMRVALADTPAQHKKVPRKIIQARIDRSSGLLTQKADETSRFEYFLQGTAPTEYEPDNTSNGFYGDDIFSSDTSDDDGEDSGSLF
ncbi:penicillin-sensitive transpeptidase [Vibrio sp. UCD-FRSSP16_10]|uniref:penicillin-binding protein 1A n=1 Tax=unclassified Vibrio TaxID=2614977 RepID=UPI0007FD9938|nr:MULTISPECIES: PBP1A family penicillin-binding protein [unclassified Vibrio]OBT10075.1 penicillin-sensitive transpeptidase [Vibrio sp. UCD-FRSSP16_30]OBT18865.1 penicillin-sensitive transpeptidase [Vibrio sp. UCD-FRSSP16_10]